jgi:hypothetical protein
MAATDAQTSLRHAFGNVLAFFILILIGVLAFSIRLFSVSISPFPTISRSVYLFRLYSSEINAIDNQPIN